MIECRDPNLVSTFFGARLGIQPSADFRGIVYVPDEFEHAVMHMEQVAVGVAYNGFFGRTCFMHSVIQRPDLVSRRMVREAFRFPFEVCNLSAVIAPVEATNDRAMRFDLKLGFKPFAVIPDGGMESDLHLLLMTRADCRWLRPH